MGLDVRMSLRGKRERDRVYQVRLRSANNAWHPPEVYLCDPPVRDGWPEAHLHMGDVGSFSDGDARAPNVISTSVRIHGVTIKALMDTLLKDPDTRRYLASGVDHFRRLEEG